MFFFWPSKYRNISGGAARSPRSPELGNREQTVEELGLEHLLSVVPQDDLVPIPVFPHVAPDSQPPIPERIFPRNRDVLPCRPGRERGTVEAILLWPPAPCP